MSAASTVTPPNTALGPGHVAAVTVAHCAAAFAALGLPPFLPRMLAEIGESDARWAGVLYVVPTLFTALSAPLWGRLADRYGRRTLLIRAQLGLAVAFTLAAFAQSLPVLAAALAAQGMLGGTFAASAAYLASGLHGRPLAKALALMQGSARAALAGAPVLAGVLAATMTIREMYAVSALLPVIAAVVTWSLPEPGPKYQADAPAVVERPVLTGARITVSGLAMAEAGFVLATVVTFPYFLPLAARIAPDLPTVASGLLFAAPHLCYLLFAAPAMHLLRAHARRGLALGYALAATSAAVHFVPVMVEGGGLTWLIAGRLLLGAALTCGLTSLSLLAAEAAADRRPGRLFGIVEACSKGGAVVAGVAASALAVLSPAAPLAVAVATGAALAAGTARITAPRLDPPTVTEPKIPADLRS